MQKTEGRVSLSDESEVGVMLPHRVTARGELLAVYIWLIRNRRTVCKDRIIKGHMVSGI